MNYVLAIDVGTTFTAAAIVQIDQNAPRIPESLPLGLRGMAVPSVVYYPEEGPVLVGEAAERRGLDTPERVVREFKRRVGDEVPLSVGTRSVPAEDIFATMARWVADRAAEREGAPPSGIIVSHPAAWGGHRTTLIRNALAARGLPDVTLISEPEAAALHYASQVRVEDGNTIAVYDLGGGTFDTAVLRKVAAGSVQHLGRPEGIEGLGGADFDAAVMRHVAGHAGEALLGLDPSDPGVRAALARLRRECVEAKEALSSDTEASISVLLPGVQQQVRLVRAEFEAMIDGLVRETVDTLEKSLQELRLTPDELSAVLLIGGSSRIPLVAQLISEQLDRPIAVDADPKSSICLGAALAALAAVIELPEAAAAHGSEQPAGTGEATAGAGAAAAAVGHLDDIGSASGVQAPALGMHGASRRPGWLRVAGSHAAGGLSSHAGKAGTVGTHVPHASVRLTGVAVAAALLTGLTATAAQSPDGFGSLSAIFVPQKARASGGGSGAPAGSTDSAGPGADASSAGGGVAADGPVKGIEASARKKDGAAARSAGLNVEASPTSRPSTDAQLTPAGSGAAGGTETSGSTAQGAGGTAAVPGSQPGTGSTPATDPVPGAVPQPTDPAVDPATDPVVTPPDPTTGPVPAPDPTTDPVPTDPAPTDPAAVPAPTTDPTPGSEPAPEPTLAPEPEPVPPAAEPVPTDTAPVVAEPAA